MAKKHEYPQEPNHYYEPEHSADDYGDEYDNGYDDTCADPEEYEDDYDDYDDLPDETVTEPEAVPAAPVHRKKKKPSAAKQVFLTVCLGLGLFAVVSGITWIALSAKGKKNNGINEQRSRPDIMEARSTTTSSATTTSLTLTELTTSDISGREQTETTTTETEATTTVSTRILPGEEEFPYFTRKYTYPDEASQNETTSSSATADPTYARYSSYRDILKKFVRKRTNADTEPMYALTDLDGDGEKELIISGGTDAGARHEVYSYENGYLNELKSKSGSKFGTLFLSKDEDDGKLTLWEITESETESSAVSYRFDGKKLSVLHTYHAANGKYAIDDADVTELVYNNALNRSAMQAAGRETALPDKPEALTEVGGITL